MFSILDLLRSDGSIVVNKRLAKEIGLNEAIIYSELVSLHKYWEDRGELTEDGWFFCTIENLEENTTIKKDTQNRAISKLEKKLGLIETKRMGLPAKRYFRITNKIFEMIIENKISQNAKTDGINVSEDKNTDEARHDQFSQNAKTRGSKMRKLDFSKSEGNNTNINNTDLKNKKNNINKLVNKNTSLKLLAMTFKEKGMSDDAILDILNESINQGLLEFSLTDVENQFNYMMDAFDNGQTFNDQGFSKYFVNGLKDRTEQRAALNLINFKKELEQQQKASRDTSFYYNWLEG